MEITINNDDEEDEEKEEDGGGDDLQTQETVNIFKMPRDKM